VATASLSPSAVEAVELPYAAFDAALWSMIVHDRAARVSEGGATLDKLFALFLPAA